ncbi:MAG: YvcK family protein [Thermomicrobiales bacterium]|nr:YvcK family protein [Thermomicrobiales bacterium]
MSVKRWAALILLGSVLTGVAMAMALVYAYRYIAFPPAFSGMVQIVTLQFLPREVRFVVVLTLGLAMTAYGVSRMSRSLLSPFLARTDPGKDLAEIVAEHRFGPRTPDINVVALGGGTGLSSLLRGLKQHDIGITAIVTVADDGGSTGRIRTEFDIPAPGDIRNCLAALADDESLVSRLFQYRFDQPSSQLSGHSFGNLFITALTQVTGSFERAVIESASVLNIRGRVLPSTLANVALNTELIDGTVLRGESSLARKNAPIKQVYLEPERAAVYEPAFGAILNADLVVLGPGSLYTSVLPNLLVEGITQALRWTPGRVVYVCNVATQPGETDDFTVADHVRVVVDQLGPNVVDVVLVNSNPASAAAIGPTEPIDPVLPNGWDMPGAGFVVVERDVVNDRNPLRHDPEKLSLALLDIARWESTRDGELDGSLASPPKLPSRTAMAAHR